MTTALLVNLACLLDDAKCFALVRQHRWPEGVRCPHCGGTTIARDGHDETQWHRQRYRCTTRAARFDDLTGTVLAGHHQSLRIWVLCLYFMGLNVSNQQIAQELDLLRLGRSSDERTVAQRDHGQTPANGSGRRG